MCQVSGLWQYRQRSGQPERKSTKRVPGPSTPVETSQEWTGRSASDHAGHSDAVERAVDHVELLFAASA